MKQVQILGTNGDKYRCSDNVLRTAINNAEHKQGSWAWCDGDFLLGGQQSSSYTLYVPSDVTECILELVPNYNPDDDITRADVIAREICSDGSLREIGRVRLKFDLTSNEGYRTRYGYFTYDKDSMFFINASDGLLYEYKKITQSKTVDITVSIPNGDSPGLFVSCPSIRLDQGNLMCVLPKVYGDLTKLPGYSFDAISNMHMRVMTYKQNIGNYIDYPISSPEPNNICMDVGCEFDEFNKTIIPYVSTYHDYVDEQGIHSTFSYYISYDNGKYQLAKQRLNMGDYTTFTYQYELKMSDKYTAIKYVDPAHITAIATKIKNNETGHETEILKKEPDIIQPYSKFYPPKYKPFINSSKKHIIFTDFMDGFGKQRFVLKDGAVLWRDETYTDVSNMDSPIITKRQARNLLEALKNMDG